MSIRLDSMEGQNHARIGKVFHTYPVTAPVYYSGRQRRNEMMLDFHCP